MAAVSPWFFTVCYCRVLATCSLTSTPAMSSTTGQTRGTRMCARLYDRFGRSTCTSRLTGRYKPVDVPSR